MPRLKDNYFRPPDSVSLAVNRAKVRKLRRLTYDCVHNHTDGESVFCGKEHKFPSSKTGAMPLLSVLRGRSSSICQKCAEREIDAPLD